MTSPTPNHDPQPESSASPAPARATTTTLAQDPFVWLPALVRANRWSTAQYSAPAVVVLTLLLMGRFFDPLVPNLLLGLVGLAVAAYLDWHWCCLRQDRVITLREYASKRPFDLFSTSAAKIERCRFTVTTTLTPQEVQERARQIADRLSTAPVSGRYTLTSHTPNEQDDATQPSRQLFSVRWAPWNGDDPIALAELRQSPSTAPGGPSKVTFEVLEAESHQLKWLGLLPVAPKRVPTLPVLEALSCALHTEMSSPSGQPATQTQSTVAPSALSSPTTPGQGTQQDGADSIWSRKKPLPVIGVVVVVGLILIGFAAATHTSASEMTCRDYNGKTSSEQDRVIRELLREHDLDDDSFSNTIGAERAVDAFCTWAPDSSKIDNAVDWDSDYW